MSEVTVGIIGGSGLYDIAGIRDLDEVIIDTPFGSPSDAFITGRLEGVRCVFMPRHGRGHRLLPHEINYRANIWGLKKLGVRHVLGVSAVGSLRQEIAPGHLVVPDQIIDRTRTRISTFFGEGCAGHVQFGDPFENNLRRVVLDAVGDVGAKVHEGGTYVCIEGPTFSTRAESELYRAWGCSIVRMTNVPEARLAREAELAYATLALSTDYDCWHGAEDEVSVESVLAIIRENVSTAKAVIRQVCKRLAAIGHVDWPSHSALGGGGAVMTSPARIPPETKLRLDLLLGHYLWPQEER
ncbi:MAG: S-methyl-5'-thioadenosine phosphorylase [Myxococcales bacterium]|nr:S-methyl-5'-thioadenosine phosphorylase [Myxococcales bacterium]